MSFKQLYVPPAGTPIFAAEAQVLVAGYSSVGGSWNPTLCAAGWFLEPWLPEQAPLFHPRFSTLESIERLAGDVVRVTQIVEDDVTINVAAIARQGRTKDADGMRLYVIADDPLGIGNALTTFVQRNRHPFEDKRALSLPTAAFCREFTRHTLRISETMAEVRRQTNLRNVGFMP